MSWIYADYLKVRSDLVDVYSQEVDATSPDLWQAFIPHGDMYQLLSRLLDSLERRGKDHTKSLWLHGAYGTGKTFAVFVVKHLLEDPLPAVEAYLTRHETTRHLWPRFRALRERGPYLVIWRSSTGHLDSQLKFFTELQQSIKNELQRQGYTHSFPGAYGDELLRRLTGPEATINWPVTFDKYRWQEFPDFAEAEAVLTAIQNGSLEVLARVSRVLEAEGVVLLLTPDQMKVGLKEIIEKNQLQGICCLWDEFTEFFIHNPTVGGLQELAQAAVELPFYMLLVTHRSPEKVYGDRDTMVKLLERFHSIHFRLQPVTAYRLAGNALEVSPERREDWERKKETLWEQVRPMAAHLFDQESNLQDFAALVPLHPYAAFLLSTIAGSFSSSQRTLFGFLKSDSAGGFVRFLREYPQSNNWYWLTPDLLWDYFFGEEAGESELTERVRTVVTFGRSRLPHLVDEPEATRLFKGILLFLALSQEMVGGEERLRAQRRNLALAFQGSPVPERLTDWEKILQEKGCLNVLPTGEDEVEYSIPLININERRLQEIKQSLENSERFEQRVRDGEELGRAVRDLLAVGDIASKRVELVVVGAEELRRRRENVQPDLKPYQMGIVAIAGLTEDQLPEAKSLAAQCANRSERVAYLVLNTPFQERRWSIWKEQLAYEKYCEEIGDRQNAQIYRQRRVSCSQEWLENLKINRHQLFFADERLSCQGTEGCRRQVEKLISQVYTAGPEKISTLGTLYTAAFGVGTFRIGLGVNPNITRQFQDLMNTLGRFASNPDSVPALRQLKAEVNDFFQDGQERRLADLWGALQQPPYGLFPSPLTAVLLGFLTKDICEGHYWSDGTSCFPLNPDRMADLLLQVVKEQRGYQDIVIRKITPLAENFCRYVKEVFNLPQQEGNYPEDLKKVLRARIQALGYPIWNLAYLNLDSEYFIFIKAYLYFLQCFLKDFEEASQGITLNEEELIEKARQAIENWQKGGKDKHTFEEVLAIINLLSEIEPVREAVRQTITPENLTRGTEGFLAAHHPELARALAAQNLPVAWVVQNLRELLQEEVWLWEEEVVRSKLPEVYANLVLLAGLNRLCGLTEDDLSTAQVRCRNEWLIRQIKLPLRFLAPAFRAKGQENQAQLYQDLDEFLTGERLDYPAKQRLGKTLQQSYLSVREDLADQAQVLSTWVQRQWGQALSVSEARSILAELPNLALETDDQKIQQEIISRWEQIQHRKLINEIQELWKSASGTASPKEWSRRQRLPIGWVLSDPSWQQFCDDFARLEFLPDELLERYRQKLQEEAEPLTNRLGDASGQQLVSVLLPEYTGLFQDGNRLTQLQDYLVARLGEAVEQWPAKLTELQDAARQWLTEYYQAIFWPEVQATVASLTVEQAKTLLQELVQEPGTGIRLLTKVKQSHAQSLS